MKLFGLIGYPLSHSFSAGYFAKKFEKENITDCEYKNFPLENIMLFKQLLSENANLHGLNVTIPYKEQVIPYLTSIDPVAEAIGAVNVIKFSKNSHEVKLTGYNSDVYGFSSSIQPYIKEYHKYALVLGSGGASKAVIYALKTMGMDVLTVSRNPQGAEQISYSNLDNAQMQRSLVIVNTTPLGMYPKTDACPDIPYQMLTNKHILFDAVYNPAETLFLQKGKAHGAFTMNGLEMLHLQAEKAWVIWNE